MGSFKTSQVLYTLDCISSRSPIDVASYGKWDFQDPATPIMQDLIDLHHDTC